MKLANKPLTGDPNSCPATFSLFVVPFAYSLGAVARQSAGVCVFTKQIPKSHSERQPLARHRYFTYETGRVLFGRTKWFELQTNANAALFPQTQSFHLESDKDVDVIFEAPRLALFEFSSALKNMDTTASQSRSSPLQTGLLIVSIHFPAHSSTMETLDFDDLLEINEMVRYYARPYNRHLQKMQKFLNREEDENEAASSVYLEDQGLRWLETPIEYKGGLYRLAETQALERAKGWVNQVDVSSDSSRELLCYADNRAFLWSCAVFGNGAAEIITNPGMERKEAPNAPDEIVRTIWQSGRWVRFLNVDSPAGESEPSEYEKSWCKKRTYLRWAHQGSVYGCSIVRRNVPFASTD